MSKLWLTEPESPLQVRGRMEMRFLPSPSPQATQKPLYRKMGFQAWRNGCIYSSIVAWQVLTQQSLWLMKMTEKMKSHLLCQETWVWDHIH